MTFAEIIKKKIERFREPQWPDDTYMRVPWGPGKQSHGFWFELYSRGTQTVLDFKTPQKIALTSINRGADRLFEFRGCLDVADPGHEANFG